MCEVVGRMLPCNTGTSAQSLRTWMGGMRGGREAQKGEDICIHTADSVCYTADTSTTL